MPTADANANKSGFDNFDDLGSNADTILQVKSREPSGDFRASPSNGPQVSVSSGNPSRLQVPPPQAKQAKRGKQ